MPLSFDLPFDQLATYERKNPRQVDFDEFWDESLGEAAELEPAAG